MKSWRKFCSGMTFKYGIALFACVIAVILSITMGAADITLKEIWNVFFRGETGTAARILWYARLPRTAACVLAGAALAVSGAITQAVLANPLASPSIIGVNAGAGLAVTVCCALAPAFVQGVSVCAFVGALVSVLFVMMLSEKTGASRMTVVLAGVAVNAMLNAMTETVKILEPNSATGSADFRVGGFSAIVSGRLLPAGILIVAGLFISLSLTNELDVMSLGEETAGSLGLSVKKMRYLLLGTAALLAGAAVSFAGLLGFVGLIVPHLCRRLVGSENTRLIPMCILVGAALVTVCDLAARLLFAPYELPAGILLAFIGGPFFLFLLFRQRGGRHYD